MGFQGEKNKEALAGIRRPLKLFSSFTPDSSAAPRYCRLVHRDVLGHWMMSGL